MDGLSGKVGIVVGGGSGIGAACARVLARHGVSVAVADIDATAARAVADSLPGAMAVVTDVTDAASVQDAVDAAQTGLGPLRLAVNSAGGGGARVPTAELTVASWRESIDMYLSGVFYCLRAEIPAMARNGGGAIVNVASVLSAVGRERSPGYIAAKHGMIGLTRAAAIDHAADNVRVNAVAPGYIVTPMLERLLDREAIGQLRGLHPAGRLGTADEVAAMVSFLLSDDAAFCTAGCHFVDGGYTAR